MKDKNYFRKMLSFLLKIFLVAFSFSLCKSNPCLTTPPPFFPWGTRAWEIKQEVCSDSSSDKDYVSPAIKEEPPDSDDYIEIKEEPMDLEDLATPSTSKQAKTKYKKKKFDNECGSPSNPHSLQAKESKFQGKSPVSKKIRIVHECNFSNCHYTTARKGDMRKHIRTHTKEKPFTCSICSIAFSQRSHLKVHERIHTGNKPFHCITCGANFSWRINLKRHLVTHSGNKSFHCKSCGSSFSLKPHLKRHLMIHSGNKPFKCDHCGKSFDRKDALREHIRTHGEERPYSCNHCAKSYKTKSNLKKHMRLHNKNKLC